ncbi:DUF192 domain-containing protein [uncultured Thiodictyon sp.]|uniref:DUF192 domain-containing protein n=1 Tax=uncultured Thiodictyon sp. TaxID=1846217 RepID=UPI0025FD2215|nr:DUF192 domain-containing protein [uncultured Thiodictyon sp.]
MIAATPLPTTRVTPLRAIPVGWVERSETHRQRFAKALIAGFRSALPSLQSRERQRRPPHITALLALLLGLTLVQGLSAADHAKVRVGTATFRVELAQTPEELTRGLMFRQRLPADQGMLFILQPPGRAVFWMKNTLIPLDLLYFDGNGVLRQVVADAPPCRQPVCPTYPSESSAIRYILEINGGEAARRAIRVGDALELGRP